MATYSLSEKGKTDACALIVVHNCRTREFCCSGEREPLFNPCSTAGSHYVLKERKHKSKPVTFVHNYKVVLFYTGFQ